MAPSTLATAATTKPAALKGQVFPPEFSLAGLCGKKPPAARADGVIVPRLHSASIILDNPKECNSYNSGKSKGVIPPGRQIESLAPETGKEP